MPTLFRFLFTLAVLGGLVYAAMVALALYVHPKQAQMEYRIPASRINQSPKTLAGPAPSTAPKATAPDSAAPSQQ